MAMGGMLALAFHVPHLDEGHAGGDSHPHCCLYHTFAIGAAPAAVLPVVQHFIAHVELPAAPAPVHADPLFLNAPRPPPFA
jgi:hypothetical protein